MKAWRGPGSLDYEACDAKRCFNPASVPLSWALTLKSLIRNRPSLKKQCDAPLLISLI
jgi:hypothetical protein